MGKVTINDIARKAGVSKTAVSFAFNNPDHLSEATRDKIHRIADELGYIPDPVARSMSTGKTGTIGILVPQPIPDIMRNPFIPEFLEGVGEACTEASFSLMIVPPLEGSIRRAIKNAAVDGFLTLGLEETKKTMMVLKQRRMPYVTVDSDPIIGISAVNVDDENGARDAMREVIAAGHRDIVIVAILSGKACKYEEYVGTVRARMNGYLAALKENDLELDGKRIRLIESFSTREDGIEAFKDIWKSNQRPTAIIAMSDIIALGIMKAAQDAGVRVPQELSIIGFDDLPLSSMVTPALTTIAQPLREKGCLATQVLLAYINGDKTPQHHVLPTQLIKRHTLCPPAEDTFIRKMENLFKR
jgi:alanine racemase